MGNNNSALSFGVKLPDGEHCSLSPLVVKAETGDTLASMLTRREEETGGGDKLLGSMAHIKC